MNPQTLTDTLTDNLTDTSIETATAIEASAKALAKDKSGNTLSLLRFLLSYHGIFGIYFIGGFTAVLAIITVARFFTGTADADSFAFPWLMYGAIISAAKIIYMFVLGICFPFYLSWLMLYGFTRKQYVFANLTAGLIAITALTLFCYCAEVIVDHNILGTNGTFLDSSGEAIIQHTNSSALAPLYALPNDFPYLLINWTDTVFNFIMGWIIALGFQLRRVLTAAGGIIIVALITGLVSFQGFVINAGAFSIGIEANGSTVADIFNSINIFIWPLALILLSALLVMAIQKISKRIPIKC